MVFNRSRRLFNPLLLAPEGLTLYESSKDNRFKEMQEGRTGEGRGGVEGVPGYQGCFLILIAAVIIYVIAFEAVSFVRVLCR